MYRLEIEHILFSIGRKLNFYCWQTLISFNESEFEKKFIGYIDILRFYLPDQVSSSANTHTYSWHYDLQYKIDRNRAVEIREFPIYHPISVIKHSTSVNMNDFEWK